MAATGSCPRSQQFSGLIKLSQQIWRHGDGFNPKWRDEIVIAIGFLLAQTYSLAIENGRENMMMVGGNQERAKGLNILAPSLSASYSNL